ncbi:hypothetical protein [Algoriphagus sp.]|uniref:hypothetical protein n=1 Tax=Algoriphagus sp. TaxID=1872435 RepID=UPI00391BF1B8
MKKLFLSVLVLFCFYLFGNAQEKCASILNLDNIQKYDPDRYQRILQIEEHVKLNLEAGDLNNLRSIPAIIRIPVVVHVLHNGEPIGNGLNISLAQIESQIEVLNEDFRRLNTDAANTPAEFLPVAADTEIEFYLACIDPDGNPSDGVIR